MKKTIIIFTVLLVFAATNSCKKDNDSGYMSNGSNVNTVKTYEVFVGISQWTYSNLYERWYYRYPFSANSNSGIFGYVMSGSGLQAMPYYTCPSFMCEQYDLANALFESPPYIEFQYTNYITKTSSPSEEVEFSLVIIPPAVIIAHPNVNWKNYNEVKSVFNLN
jgi:hypothetical protein